MEPLKSVPETDLPSLEAELREMDRHIGRQMTYVAVMKLAVAYKDELPQGFKDKLLALYIGPHE